jgi:hypothetical protein
LPEGVAGIAALHALVADHLPEEAEPLQVLVGIETDREPWVQTLIWSRQRPANTLRSLLSSEVEAWVGCRIAVPRNVRETRQRDRGLPLTRVPLSRLLRWHLSSVRHADPRRDQSPRGRDGARATDGSRSTRARAFPVCCKGERTVSWVDRSPVNRESGFACLGSGRHHGPTLILEQRS